MVKRLSVAVLLLVVSSPLLAATHAEKIDALLAAYNSRRYFNGSALVAENGTVIVRKGYGLANMEWQIPNTPDTKFRLGSITKQFTSMVIMQLVHEGKIKLEEKITTYLPDYRKDTGDKVAVWHLLTHTSGIPSYTSLPGFLQNRTRDPYTVADFIKKYASGDLEFRPGTRFSYDNSGYFLLGAIIERVTGKSYEQNLQERIFDPLGMSNSGYDHSAKVLPKRASGYVLTLDGYENAPYLDMSIPYAAGSLYSTVDDLYKWDRALYTDKLLPPDLKQAMFTPVLRGYGFGWRIATLSLDDKRTEVSTLMHAGGINGFNTREFRMPDTQDLVVLLDNTSRDDKLDALARGIVDILHEIEPPAPKPALADALATNDSRPLSVRIRELKNTVDTSEEDVNRLGYQLLQRGRVADAVEIFRFNAEEYPTSWNAFDSLAEAYAAHGDRELAVANYKKSLELNPQNTHAADALKELSKPTSP